MVEVVADLRTDLREMGETGPELSLRLLQQYARLLSFVRAYALGEDPGALGTCQPDE